MEDEELEPKSSLFTILERLYADPHSAAAAMAAASTLAHHTQQHQHQQHQQQQQQTASQRSRRPRPPRRAGSSGLGGGGNFGGGGGGGVSHAELMDKSLVNLSSEVRTVLEDRFIDAIRTYSCFYDPNDKNFANNQYKSLIYSEIAEGLQDEGVQTTGKFDNGFCCCFRLAIASMRHFLGTQLAAVFKSLKAKYRDEARKQARSNGQLEPSNFFRRLGFLHEALTCTDK